MPYDVVSGSYGVIHPLTRRGKISEAFKRGPIGDGMNSSALLSKWMGRQVDHDPEVSCLWEKQGHNAS